MMQTDDTLSLIQQVLSEETGEDARKINPETRLVEDLDVDSLSKMALMTKLEQEMNIRLSDEEVSSVRTVNDCLHLVRMAASSNRGSKA